MTSSSTAALELPQPETQAAATLNDPPAAVAGSNAFHVPSAAIVLVALKAGARAPLPPSFAVGAVGETVTSTVAPAVKLQREKT